MDNVASLDSWKPSRTLSQPTSQFSKADAGVRLNTGRHIGVGIEVTRREGPSATLNMKMGGNEGNKVDVPSPLSSNLNAFINSPPRSVRMDSGKKVPNR